MVLTSVLFVSFALAAPSAPCVDRSLSELISRGRPAAATAALNALPPPANASETACREVLRGRIALAEGAPKVAADHFATAAPSLPQIRPTLTVMRAEALRGQEQSDATAAFKIAQKALRRAPEPLRERLVNAEAEFVLRTAAPKTVLSKLQTLLRGQKGDAPQKLALLAAAHLRAGDAHSAQANHRKLLVEYPASDEARAVEDQLDDGRLTLEANEAADRIMGLIQASRMARAEREALAFDRKRAPFGAGRIDLEVATTQALVRAGRANAAVDHIAGEIVALSAQPKATTVPDAWLEANAWALGKAKRHDEAQAAWQRLSIDASDDALKVEACFLGGFLAYEVDRFDVAEREWKRCEPLLSQTSRGDQALWYLALIDILRGDRAGALAQLRALVRSAPKDRERDKHDYWLAVVLDDGGTERDKIEAKKLWARVHRANETSYYGMLARRQLGRPPVSGITVSSTALSDGVTFPEPIATLYALGLDADARAYAKMLPAKVNKTGILQALGDAHTGWRRGARELPYPQVSKDTLVDVKGWRASYPEPWSTLVPKAAADAKIAPSFVYAIMRTESGFLPDAKSIAGALGLLQLMPYTAVGIAKAVNLPPPPPQDLVYPDVNIPLGAHFLGLSSREFGALYLAAAAYNGDPRNVADWMKRFQGTDVELFVERVPFRETRDYIKKVLATEAIYRALNGAPLTLALPEGKIGPPPATYTAFQFTDDGDDLNDDE